MRLVIIYNINATQLHLFEFSFTFTATWNNNFSLKIPCNKSQLIV